MANGFEVTIKDNSAEILSALKNAINRGLKACGEKAKEYAQDKVPKDTWNLHDNINYVVEGNECQIGVNHMDKPYGIYVEFGTGKYAETGGRQTSWVYQDENGVFHRTEGVKPRPFIRPAAADHAEEYRDILKDSLENA